MSQTKPRRAGEGRSPIPPARVFEPLRPLIRNQAFTAVQAAMIAIAKDDPDAAHRCVQIALDAIATWREGQETRGPDRIEQLEAALYRIKQWADAYPPSVFPPVDEQYAQKAHEVLTANGMTLDRLSADAMRHVVQGVGKIAREALTK